MANLQLNAVPIACKENDEIMVGVQAYETEALKNLRSKYSSTYLFKRGGENGGTIFSVALKPDLPILGDRSETIKLSSAPWLLCPLALESLLKLFNDMERPILKLRPLRLLSQRPANLLPEGYGLPDWLQQRLVLDLETRVLHRSETETMPILLCNARTRNSISANCKEISQAGVSLLGKYVATKV